jgi:hypothetical protein
MEADVEILFESNKMKMSQVTKERLSFVVNGTQFVFRWSLIPAILYLGYRKGSDA